MSGHCTELGQSATIVGEHDGLYYGFILDDDRDPHTILHMRWDSTGKAINLVGSPMLCVNWDLTMPPSNQLPGDICLWADGRWCDRDSMSWSDCIDNPDYILIPEGTAEWADFCINQGLL